MDLGSLSPEEIPLVKIKLTNVDTRFVCQTPMRRAEKADIHIVNLIFTSECNDMTLDIDEQVTV